MNVGLLNFDARSDEHAGIETLLLDRPARETAGTVRRKLIPAAALAVSDATSGLVALTLLATVAPSWSLAGDGVLFLALAVLSQILLKSLFGLYPGYGLHPEASLSRATRAWGGAALIGAVAAWGLGRFGAAGIGVLLAAFLLVLLLQLLGRLLVRSGLERAGLWGLPACVMGEPERVAALEGILRKAGRYGLVPTRWIHDASIVLWADKGLPDAATLAQLRRCHIDVHLVSDLPTLSLSGLKPRDHGGTIGLRLARPGKGGPGQVAKRVVDLAVAVPASVIAAPIIALAALVIWAIDPGPVFYSQMREGKGGKPIRVWKLRSMYCDADRMLQRLLEHDDAARAEWEAHFKLRDDPRILPYFGRILRASSLDELPQLINILRGDMSLVGPRPFPDYHLAAMPAEFRRRRGSVMPGLTGLLQISERSNADVAVQEQIDTYYLDNRSFWFDLSILLRTFHAVFRGRGAY